MLPPPHHHQPNFLHLMQFLGIFGAWSGPSLLSGLAPQPLENPGSATVFEVEFHHFILQIYLCKFHPVFFLIKLIFVSFVCCSPKFLGYFFLYMQFKFKKLRFFLGAIEFSARLFPYIVPFARSRGAVAMSPHSRYIYFFSIPCNFGGKWPKQRLASSTAGLTPPPGKSRIHLWSLNMCCAIHPPPDVQSQQ